MIPEDLEALRYESDGALRLVPCLSFGLYHDGYEPEAMMEFVTAATELLRPYLTHVYTNTMRFPRKFDAKAEAVVPAWFAKPREYQPYLFALWGDGAEGTSPAYFKFLFRYGAFNDPRLDTATREKRRENWTKMYGSDKSGTYPYVSYFRLTIPLDHPLGAEGFRDFLLARPVVANGNFASGLAGLRLSVDRNAPRDGTSSEVIRRCRLAGVEHPGLDLDHTDRKLQAIDRWHAPSRDMVPHMVRANWLTFVSDRSAPLIGEIADVERRLTAFEGVRVVRCGGGMMVQAGDAPIPGDGLGDPALAPYRHVAKVLRPMRLAPQDAIGKYVDESVIEWFEDLDQP
ncbi:type VI immunity family protein [Consotaella aegiceratis]|uniref:type VI immunity family protein n=1 Tax=Consotaella aegiceratis TaxID=3097961 RepID=UPI002F3F8700